MIRMVFRCSVVACIKKNKLVFFDAKKIANYNEISQKFAVSISNTIVYQLEWRKEHVRQFLQANLPQELPLNPSLFYQKTTVTPLTPTLIFAKKSEKPAEKFKIANQRKRRAEAKATSLSKKIGKL